MAVEQSPAQPAPAPGSGRYAGIAVGIAVPLLAAGLYMKLGSPEAINMAGQPPAQSAGHGGPGGGMSPEQIQGMIQALAARLEQNPNDAEGWAMLARSRTAIGRY